MPEIPPRPIFQRSYETNLLVERLLDLEPGELVTYGELAELVSADMSHGGQGRAALASARAIAQREHGIVTDCDPGVGIVRARDVEIVDGALRYPAKARRAFGRAIERLSKADYQQLDDHKRHEFNSQMAFNAQCLAAASMARYKAIKTKVTATAQVDYDGITKLVASIGRLSR